MVVASKEENRDLDVRRLRDAGIRVRVRVSEIETVPQALAASTSSSTTCSGGPGAGWLEEARELRSGEPPAPAARMPVPIWRDPWMIVGSRTFTGYLLHRFGGRTR